MLLVFVIRVQADTPFLRDLYGADCLILEDEVGIDQS